MTRSWLDSLPRSVRAWAVCATVALTGCSAATDPVSEAPDGAADASADIAALDGRTTALDVSVDGADVSFRDDGIRFPDDGVPIVEDSVSVVPDTVSTPDAADVGLALDAVERLDSGDGGQDVSVDPSTDSGGAVDAVSDDAVSVSDAFGPDTNAAPQLPNLQIGAPAGESGYVLLFDGDSVEIVQGPQGGIHAGVSLQVTLSGESTDAPVIGALDCRTWIDDELVGLLVVGAYAIAADPEQAGAVYTSPEITLFFADDVADPYVGLTAVTECSYEPLSSDVGVLEDTVTVILLDDV